MADDESNVPYTEVLRSLSAEKFAEVFGASSRKARETYFHRHGVRGKGGSGFAKPGAKNEARIAKLYDVIASGADDDEMAEEMLRTWLLTKRPMLAAALDHLGIDHEDGLTESEDLSKFEKLSKRDIGKLLPVLEEHGSREDAAVYLRFMGVPGVDSKLS